MSWCVRIGLGHKESQIMDFLHHQVFDPVLNSPNASQRLKTGIRLTIARMSQRDARGMVAYFWSAIQGTDRSIRFAEEMSAEGFTRFEEVLEQFRSTFDERFLSE